MQKKQITGIIVAAIMFIVVCASSMGMNLIAKVVSNKTATTASSFFGGQSASLPAAADYVAKVYVCGEMASNTAASVMSTDTMTYNHEYLMNYVDELIADNNNVGILLFVNSPGGYVYMADELYCKLKDYKETGRPIYCFFDNMAASGGYYISMASDEIYAKKMCTTGSIGVILSTYNLSGLFEKYGIQEVVIKSAANKGAGSIGTAWTEEQLAIEQSMVDEYYGYFIDAVEEGRGLPRETVKKLADGRAYTATQALNNGLIDGIMDYDDYEDRVMSNFDSSVILYEDQTTENPFAMFLGKMEDISPKSDLQIFKEVTETMESGVPKYESTY